tara:strand:- start:993 stop:1529 length:537 start_codon:yes stop_codon:yes gene_type:complete
MQSFFIALLGIFLFVNSLQAQEKGFEVGFQLSEYQQDFGLGIQITSPYLFKESIALRLRANKQYLQHIDKKEVKEVWTPYLNLSLGVFGHRAKIHEKVALYGEGGVIGLIPNDKFSDENFVFGGYGLFGFEFYFIDSFCYFIEAGGVGTGATADQIPSEPIYCNGFLMNVGFRIIFNN